MSDNWVVQNLENALETWNSKLSEIWQLLTTSPQQFKGGSIWSVMVNINGAVQAIGPCGAYSLCLFLQNFPVIPSQKTQMASYKTLSGYLIAICGNSNEKLFNFPF